MECGLKLQPVVSKNAGKPSKPDNFKIDAGILNLVLDRVRELSFNRAGRFKLNKPAGDFREKVSRLILVFNGRKKWEGADAEVIGVLLVGKEDSAGLIEVRAVSRGRKVKTLEIYRILREELGLISLSEFNRRVREQKMLVFMEVKRAKKILDECDPKVEDIDTEAPDFPRKNRQFCAGSIIEDLLLPICGLCGRAVREGEQYVSVGVGAIHMNMKEGADPDYLSCERYHLNCVQYTRSVNSRRTTPVYKLLREEIENEIQQENCVKLLNKLV